MINFNNLLSIVCEAHYDGHFTYGQLNLLFVAVKEYEFRNVVDQHRSNPCFIEQPKEIQ